MIGILSTVVLMLEIRECFGQTKTAKNHFNKSCGYLPYLYITNYYILYIYIFYWQHKFTKFVGKNNLKKKFIYFFGC